MANVHYICVNILCNAAFFYRANIFLTMLYIFYIAIEQNTVFYYIYYILLMCN